MGLATRKRSPLTWSAESTEWTRIQVLARKMNEDPLFQRERRYRPVKEESDFMPSPQRLSLVATLCAFVALNWCDGLCLVTPCVATKNNAVSFIMHNIYCTTESTKSRICTLKECKVLLPMRILCPFYDISLQYEVFTASLKLLKSNIQAKKIKSCPTQVQNHVPKCLLWW